MSSSGTSPPELPLFVLDESFPQPIVGATVLRSQVRKRVSLDIRLLGDLDETLYETHDHDLIRALDAQGVEGCLRGATMRWCSAPRYCELLRIRGSPWSLLNAQATTRSWHQGLCSSISVRLQLSTYEGPTKSGVGAAPSRAMSVE